MLANGNISLNRYYRSEPLQIEDGAKETHAYFMTEQEVIYENHKTTIKVVRDDLIEPPQTQIPYPSRRAMLLEELSLRNESVYRPEMKHVCYSDVPRASFDAFITLKEDLPTLSLQANQLLSLRNQYFYHSRLNGKSYIGSDHKIHTVHHAIPSSWDYSSEDLMMGRALRDEKGTICYAGKPDTKKRAIQQAKDIFETERDHLKAGPDGVYELTYVVNSLTNGSSLEPPGRSNERDSLQKEIETLEEIKGVWEFEGVQVRLNPIHVHHTLSCWSRFAPILPESVSGVAIEKEINSSGYEKIIEAARKVGHPLLEDTIYHLKHSQMPPHERLILVDLITKIAHLPIVHHCRSSVNRTPIGIGISMINHLIIHSKIPLSSIPKVDGRFAIHLLSREEDYKALFLASLDIQHQVSKDARISIQPDGRLEGREQLGLHYHTNMFGTDPGAIALLPEKCLKRTWAANPSLKMVAIATVLLLSPLLLTIYYIALSLGVIVHSSRKGWQNEFYQTCATLPLHILWRWANLSKIDASKMFDFNSLEINGSERALLIGAKTTKTNPDPRLIIFPNHMRPIN